jgi:KDO2-lipid IV(A) lauroyltransferase
MSLWKNFRRRLEYIGLVLGAWLVQRLPWRSLRPIGYFVGALVFFFDRKRREVAFANLKVAFEESYDERERVTIAKKSYQIFAATMLELLWSPRLTPQIMDEIADIEVVDLRSSPRLEGVPAIYCCAHAANFEWTGQIAARYTKKFPVIAQKFKNPRIGKLFNRWRSSLGQEVIPQEQAMLKLFRYLKTGGKFGILVDLNLKPQEGPVVVTMFERLLTPLTRLPAELALRTGALLVPVECRIRPQGGYTLRFLEPISVTSESTVESLTQAYWDVLESSIRRHPEYWLWNYKHWRYRPSHGENDFYPFYANCFPPFDALIAQQKSCEESGSVS